MNTSEHPLARTIADALNRHRKGSMNRQDPERIAPMLDLLGAIWREHPDWRLGQLLGNVVDTQDVDHVMLFHVEDDVVAAGLLAMTSERRRIGGEQAQ